MYESIVEHKGLGKYKVVRARDTNELASKVEELKNKWNYEYSQKLIKEKEANIKKQGETEAQTLTNLYKDTQDTIENYLNKSASFDYNIQRIEGKLPDYTEKINKINMKEKPQRPEPGTYQDYPLMKSASIAINIVLYPIAFFVIMICIALVLMPLGSMVKSFVSSLTHETISLILGCSLPFLVFYLTYKIASRFNKKIMTKFFSCKINNDNKQKVREWEDKCKQVDKENKEIEKKNKKLFNEWENNKAIFEAEQQEKRNLLNRPIDDYDNGIIEGVTPYFRKVLMKLPQIDVKSKQDGANIEIEYNNENKILLVNYPLPDFEGISKLPKEVKYISSKGEFKTIYHSDTSIRKMYDSLIYQIIFSIAYAIFSGDRKQYVESIVINGFLNTIDRSIGRKVIICISSLHINRKEFEELDLQQIDPKQCFKRLKGVAGIQMDTQTPVAPIMQINKDDKRFVVSYDVAKNIDVGTNLAAMDWQDFENLIRELFEWKFSTNGGECKITQVSRDGGVDAIAFDPDPILGGKIIIQAKRYTNVVGVSAVRDLYGTLINEGASKGILITTSDYGSDAHKFAKGKPITLLNGNNLLHLLNEMGTKAYINIKEAKKLLKEEKK